MALEVQIETEIKKAMKARDAIKVSTLRMLKAEMNNLKIDENKKELSDIEVIKIVRRQIKQHKDSIEQFEKGKRQDLVEKEKKELAILKNYMPEQCSPEELKKIVEEAVRETGASSKKDMGRVMKAVMEKVKGRSDGKTVSQIVSSILK
ncbi:MAG: GatB/YqeY domain-containing protein [Omnitrophica bacterium]|nr:GatB/YqeY domain-containing protein [Candidatus Omnitrophota bacterium]